MILLRASLFNLYFYLLTFVLGLAGIAVRLFARDHALDFARFWVRLVLAGLRCICGIRVVVLGAENLPRAGAALVASQHQSAFDTLVWLTLVPRPSYVLKQELTRIPLFGPLLRPAGMIAVDRAAGAAALRGLLRETGAALKAGRQVVIFPEGTRVAAGERVKLHPGIVAIATHNRMPIIPVATDSGLRWGRRAFRKRAGVIHIVIGAPIPADTAKADILGRIEAGWRDGAQRIPVDKSVE
ncbi:MAG TPA: lysophospholipid acyltransferase family protein [Acetobacteraceae bacterium]|nr:lysophospholipid acyltransferase family protein [Acetobacteraceae bacterium]